jgi:hypothetical protein
MSDDPQPRQRVYPDPGLFPAKTVSGRINGRFAKGFSGNPSGPQPGGAAARYVGGPMVISKLVQVLRDAALAGDKEAAKILMPLLLPKARAEPIAERVDLPELDTLESCRAALATVARETAAARMSPDDATILTNIIRAAIDGFYRSEVDALKAELAELKELVGDLPHARRYPRAVGRA